MKRYTLLLDACNIFFLNLFYPYLIYYSFLTLCVETIVPDKFNTIPIFFKIWVMWSFMLNEYCYASEMLWLCTNRTMPNTCHKIQIYIKCNVFVRLKDSVRTTVSILCSISLWVSKCLQWPGLRVNHAHMIEVL